MNHFNSDHNAPSRSPTGLTRRTALSTIGGLTATALLPAGSQADRVMAQDATPVPLDPLFTEYVAAWEGDTARIDGLYVADVTGVDYATGEIFNGADSIRTHIEGLHASFNDLTFTATSGFVCGVNAVLEFIFSGIYVGQQTVNEGQQVSSQNVAVFVLADGKIARESHYYDYYAVLRQLDAVPRSNQGSSPSPSSAAGGPTLELVDVAFNPTTFSIAANTDVTVTLINKGIAPHNFAIDALAINVDVTPGATKVVTINAPAGTYDFYCAVPGHTEAGMIGTLSVT